METSASADSAALSPADEALRFERLLAAISSQFIDLPIGRIDEAINDALRRIVTVLGVDRCTLSSVDPNTGLFYALHSWAAAGFAPVPKGLSSRSFPWALARYRAGLSNVFSNVDELPPEAAQDAQSHRSIGMRSHIGVPVMVSGEFVATLGVGALREERIWTEALVTRMQLLGDIFGSALARKRAQDRIDALLGFERLVAELSTSLVGAPVIDLDIQVTAVLREVAHFLGADHVELWTLIPSSSFKINQQWPDSRQTQEGMPVPNDESLPWTFGQILDGATVRIATLRDLPEAATIDAAALQAMGVKSLLGLPLRSHDALVGALTLHCLRDERLWPEEIGPRLGLLGKMLIAALAYRDTERQRQRATAEATQSREHLAHLARIDAVGAMSAAIAHEINQPLMAISNYALAGRRRLVGFDRGGLDPAVAHKLDALMEKIRAQANLASEVIARLRGMVKQRETREEMLDPEYLVRNALQLIEIEARLHDVHVDSFVAAALPPAMGDEIQIQQVIMNLARNAMEAMAGMDSECRQLRLEVDANPAGGTRFSLADRGPGIPAGDCDRIFEPFYTTKGNGLGIGLAICRSIVEAHGGRLWLTPRPEGGSIFHFTLPEAQE